MSSVAIITARGGSKRIPRKNIKEFCGRPIIAFSIEAALDSKLFDDVMVSTDDNEIADVAKRFGASVPFMRNAATSDDYATTTDVLHEVLSEYEKRGKTFDVMCCIYPTAPFVTSEKLRSALETLKQSDADLVIPVVKFSYPPQRAFVMNDGCLQYKWPQYVRSRSQDLEPFYHDAGQFYIWAAKKFSSGAIQKIVPYLLDELEVQDIDNLSDWRLAEIKYRLMREAAS
ncbi:MAG: pseudaminic acid cytidylyltransferase [Selenomonadaceae bacterium]|nr:pseudaminic acid cytidylyltransferase [Selenomonadaceae bacterium]